MDRKGLQKQVKELYGKLVDSLEYLYRVMDLSGKEGYIYQEVMDFWEFNKCGGYPYLPRTKLMKILTYLDLSLAIYEDYPVAGEHSFICDCTKLVYRLTLDVMEKFGVKVKDKRLRYYDYLSAVNAEVHIKGLRAEDYYVSNTIGYKGNDDAKSDLDRFLEDAKGLMDLLNDKNMEEE